MMVLIFLTDVKDEGVAESVVSVVTSVDQELCVGDHRAAVPAVGSQNKSLKQEFKSLSQEKKSPNAKSKI